MPKKNSPGCACCVVQEPVTCSVCENSQGPASFNVTLSGMDVADGTYLCEFVSETLGVCGYLYDAGAVDSCEVVSILINISASTLTVLVDLQGTGTGVQFAKSYSPDPVPCMDLVAEDIPHNTTNTSCTIDPTPVCTVDANV